MKIYDRLFDKNIPKPIRRYISFALIGVIAIFVLLISAMFRLDSANYSFGGKEVSGQEYSRLFFEDPLIMPTLVISVLVFAILIYGFYSKKYWTRKLIIYSLAAVFFYSALTLPEDRVLEGLITILIIGSITMLRILWVLYKRTDVIQYYDEIETTRRESA